MAPAGGRRESTHESEAQNLTHTRAGPARRLEFPPCYAQTQQKGPPRREALSKIPCRRHAERAAAKHRFSPPKKLCAQGCAGWSPGLDSSSRPPSHPACRTVTSMSARHPYSREGCRGLAPRSQLKLLTPRRREKATNCRFNCREVLYIESQILSRDVISYAHF